MQQLTEWGKKIEKRLNDLGKDWKWVCQSMSLRGYKYSWAELMHLICEENQSTGRKNAVERLLREEERRQNYRRKIGFKGEGICHTRSERQNNSKNS